LYENLLLIAAFMILRPDMNVLKTPYGPEKIPAVDWIDGSTG
jgi:hypothetical protein